MAGRSAPAVDFFSKDDAPHGYAKRFMWMRYLQAFVAKTQYKYNTLIYDGFAGAGVYGDKLSDDIAKYGSPLIAMHVSIQYFIRKNKTSHSFLPCLPQYISYSVVHRNRQMEKYRIQLYLVEKEKKYFKGLVKNVIIVFSSYKINCIKITRSPDCVEIFSDDDSISLACRISCKIFEYVDPPVVSASDRLVSFIDPFGFTQIPMSHVQKFVGLRKEIFINFMSQFVNRFLDVNEQGMQLLYGMDKAKIELRLLRYTSDRLENGMSLYKDILKENCNTKAFPLSFEMRDKRNHRLYHMIFISCHEKGFEAMKEAMNRGTQDQRKFVLSDFLISKKGQTMNLGNGQEESIVAEVIFQKFKDKRQPVSIHNVIDFVVHHTIFVWRKKPLKVLLKDRRITRVVDCNGKEPKRKRTFPDGTEWFLTFCTDFENVAEGIEYLKI